MWDESGCGEGKASAPGNGRIVPARATATCTAFVHPHEGRRWAAVECPAAALIPGVTAWSDG